MTSQYRTLKRTSLRFALAALALACTAGAASAATHDEISTRTVRVSVADLDLSTSQGVATLESRINRATRRACGGHPAQGPLMLTQMQDYRECRRAARVSAIAAAENVGVRFADARPFTLAMRD